MRRATILLTMLLLLPTWQAAPATAVPLAPVSNANCRSTLTPAETAALVAASDTSTMGAFADAQPRVATVRRILTAHEDNRGIFAIFYDHVLRTAVPAVADAQQWNDPAWVERASRTFVVAYLDNLHGHLTGGSITREWRSYYGLAADCKRTVGRVATQALIAHLVVDFPEAIAAAGSKPRHFADFLKVGDLLVAATEPLTADIAQVYGQDLSSLLHAFWFGQFADCLAGAPITTPTFLQSVRINAWLDGLALANPLLAPGTRWSMAGKFGAAATMLDAMEFVRLI